MAEIAYKKIGVNKYQIEPQEGMKAEAVFYAKEEMLPLISGDRSLQQLVDTASLPDLISPVIAMPDMHEGFGIPVGGIMVSDKIVCVGCVGMDINCGVRLLNTGVVYDSKIFTLDFLRRLMRSLEKVIPIGLGGKHKSSQPQLKLREVIIHGAQAVVAQHFGTDEDIEKTEEEGKIKGAEFGALSERALNRAQKQIGTLGSGNHFMELERVAEIYDQQIGAAFGLSENQLCFMIHSGSRALGHQTCLDYTRIFYKKEREFGIRVPNRELASLPIDSDEGQAYLGAMYSAINFAFANRQLMAYKFRQVFEELMKSVGIKAAVKLVYDVAHNSAKFEHHHGKHVLVHRKGATRALPPDHEDNPESYLKVGHPVLIPGSMATGSYVLVGTKEAAETFYSVNHGAGRVMSRSQAKRTISRQEFEEQMKQVVYNKPFEVIRDEAPGAYKDLDLVIRTLEEAGIAKRVARLVPLAVIKGD